MELSGYTTGGFARGVPAWKEALWLVAKWAFFQTAIPWPSALRVSLLRAFGARVGNGVVVRSHVNITFPWRLSIGDHVWLGEEVLILSLAAVRIESDVCISQRAFLCTGSHRFQTPRFELVTKPITVGRGCWIAAQVFVAPGVTVGPDSMLAAGAVVVEDVPAGVLMQGNPARVVRTFGRAGEVASQPLSGEG
jgi:putative colanic acid biosynthesis acetyltransferase WcaF